MNKLLNYKDFEKCYKGYYKLDEWSNKFTEWVESLPYAKELIIGEKDG